MTHPSVREASAADLPALRAIQLVTLAEPWHELLPVAVAGPQTVLVYADPRPAGYALAFGGDGTPDSTGPPGSDERPPVEPGGREAYLAELAVAPPRQGAGVGSALLSTLVDRLRDEGYDRLRATVRAVDERAREFYLSRGFVGVDTLEGHFESGDGYLLVRELG